MARSAGRSPSSKPGSGLKVFDRGARGVALTIEGQRLFLRTSEAFALIADNTDRWVEPRGAAVVRLASIPSIGGLWLIPRLTALEGGTPPLRIVLEVDLRQTDLADEGIDLSVRCGRGGIAGRISVQLFEEHCFPIASPELAEKIGRGRPERLLKYPLIHDSDASGWRAWLGAHGIDYRPRPQDRRFEDYNLVLDAAANGLGIALAPAAHRASYRRPPRPSTRPCATGLLLARRPRRVDRAEAGDRPPRAGRQAHRAQPGLLLARPAARPLRPAAAELATRIAAEAGVATGKLDAFLRAER